MNGVLLITYIEMFQVLIPLYMLYKVVFFCLRANRLYPVSYTHLDVYKRQALCSLRDINSVVMILQILLIFCFVFQRMNVI